jgi:hypothetical protein
MIFYLYRWAAILASREVVQKAAAAKAEKERLALLPNPTRDWKCSGCNRMNTYVEGQFKKKKKKKQKKARNDDDGSDDSEGSGKEDDDGNPIEEPPEPIARCLSCGVAHTYVPRGRRGLAVLSENALSMAFDVFDGDNWTRKSGWRRAVKLSDWYGITADDQEDKATGAVLKIELVKNNLSGPFASSLCKLSTVTHLLLDQNGTCVRSRVCLLFTTLVTIVRCFTLVLSLFP